MKHNLEYNSNLENQESELVGFQEQIAEIFKERFPEAYEQTISQREELRENVEEREEIIEDMSISDMIEQYEGEAENIIEVNEKSVAVSVESHFMEDRLPDEYGYSGGAARALLLRNLDIDSQAEPRDIDIIRFSEEEPVEGKDIDLAREYMPKDFEFGDGVRPFAGENEYFKTRDLTVNQVYATDDKVVATKKAIKDNIRHILRVTDHEKNNFGGVGPKMMSKMIRFYADRIEKYGQAELADTDENDFENYFINPFWLAVQLDRAYENGSETAMRYIKELKTKNQIPEEITTIGEAANYLLDLMRDSDTFYFRCVDKEEGQFELEEEWREYEKYPKHLGMGKGNI